MTLLFSCGDKVTGTTILPLQIAIEATLSSDRATTEAFLQKITEYRFVFSGKFGERKHFIKRNGNPETIQVSDIPFDTNLHIKTEVIGVAWDSSKGEWSNDKILAKSEDSGSYDWREGARESVKIFCLLTEFGENTYAEIFNMYNNK